MKTLNNVSEVFRIFQNRDAYFEDISSKKSNTLIVNQILVICVFTFIYGIVMGSYHSFLQSVVSGVKVTLLFIASMLICFPSFFIIQQVLGSKMGFKQVIIIILSGFVLTATITLSFTPVIIFFQLTGGNYHFLQLLHVAIFIFAGIFGMRLMVDALKYACEHKDIYPQIGVMVFRVWIIILAFVSIQLSWNLRPFLCNKTEEFTLFRKHEGNFYAAIIYSFNQLVSGKGSQKAEKPALPARTLDATDLKNDTSLLINSKKE
jgi:hypothetical protein